MKFKSLLLEKKLLRSVGNGSDRDAENLTEQSDPSTSASAKRVSSQAQGNPVKDMAIGVSVADFGHDIETYVDEQGRVRVSKNSSMGMRMTRDLQWNLDMMKEMEKKRATGVVNSALHDKESEAVGEFPRDVLQFDEALEGTGVYSTTILDNIDEHLKEVDHPSRECSIKGKKAIEISFFEDELYNQHSDDLFTNLVVGSPCSDDYVKNPHLVNNFQNPSVDSGDRGLGKGSSSMDAEHLDDNDGALDVSNIQTTVGCSSDDGEVDWEYAPIQNSSLSVKTISDVSKLSKDEEADIQEAIRRSLEDYQIRNPLDAFGTKIQSSLPDNTQGILPLRISSNAYSSETSKKDVCKSLPSLDLINEFKVNSSDLPQSMFSAPIALAPKTDGDPSPPDHQTVESCHPEVSTGCQTNFQDETVTSNDFMGITSPDIRMESQKSQLEKVCCDDSSLKARTTVLMISVHASSVIGLDRSEYIMSDACGALGKDSVNLLSCPSESGLGHIKSHESYHTEAQIDNHFGQLSGGDFAPHGDGVEVSGLNEKFQDDVLHEEMVTEERVADEIELLRQEEMNLGDEQRKLERNAESVTSEMFTECQELLQMFGVPYIIAPMEAEAQFAYMARIGLVDGVVTDD